MNLELEIICTIIHIQFISHATYIGSLGFLPKLSHKNKNEALFFSNYVFIQTIS